MSKQKQFSGQKSYKMRESTLYCIGNSERNMDLSVIYLAVQDNICKKVDPRPSFLMHTQRSRIQKLGLF